MVEDAVLSEPASAKFPVKQGIYREFSLIWAKYASNVAKIGQGSKGLTAKFPAKWNREIFEQNRELNVRNREINA